MRLPFLQVEADLLGAQGRVAAGMLRATPACVVGYVAFMRAYVLGQSRDGEVTGMVRGTSAARVLALAAGYEGDPEVFVAALADPAVGLLEVHPDGILVRGMEPYEKARRKSEASKDRMRKSREAKLLRATPAHVPDKKKKESKTETEMKSPSLPSEGAAPLRADAPPPLALVAQEQEKARRPASPTALGEFIDWARAETKPRLAPDAPDNAAMAQHQRVRLGEAVKLHGLEALKAAFRLWMGSTYVQEKGYPMGLFASQWERHVGEVKAKPKQRDLRNGTLRAEDFDHSGPVGEVQI